MIRPAAVGTWAWIEQSTPHQICYEMSRNSTLVNSLAEEILLTKKKISYPVYSKLFSLFFYTRQLQLDPCLKIIQALQSIGFYEMTTTSEIQVVALMNQHIAAHDTEKALIYFKQIKKGFGYEELCLEAFDNSLLHQLKEFIPPALETLPPEKRMHIMNKCLRWSAETRANDNVLFWLNMGASANSVFCMDSESAAALKTTEPVKHLFHVAVLTSNPELALILISKRFDLKLLGSQFNPLDHFIDKLEWNVVKAFVSTYQVINTPQTPLSEKSVISLTKYCLNIYQLIADEITSVSIFIGMLNSGFDINYKLQYDAKHSPESLLEYICRTANGHAFIAMIKSFNGVRIIRPDFPTCNDRIAAFITSCGTSLEDHVLGLLALAETRQTIFNILLIIAETYQLDKLLGVLIDREFLIDSLLKNALQSGNYSEEFLTKILTHFVNHSTHSSMTEMIPSLLKMIKRRLTPQETLPLLKLALKGVPSIFHALVQRELPFKLSRENNLLDLTLQHSEAGGPIILLLNQGFRTNDLGKKLLLVAIQDQDQLLMERAIEHGVDLERTLIKGIDPLAYAISNNKPFAVELMIEAGRSPDKVHHRPYKDGSEDGSLKPIEMAIYSKRFKIAARLIKHSKELRENLLSYQILFKDILNDDNHEEEIKELLYVLFDDFPFATLAVMEGSLSHCIPNILKRFKELNPLEIRAIEKKGRSVLEIPWLFDQLNTLAIGMLRTLSQYQCVLTLDLLHKRLGKKSSVAFNHLLGIDRFHYQTIEVTPVLEPIISPEWDIAVSKLMGVCSEVTDQYLSELMDLLGSEGKLEHGLEDYPEPAAAVFLKHFDSAHLINELAKLLSMIQNPEDRMKIISHLFKDDTLPTCLGIHHTLINALFILYQPIYKSLIDPNETFRDDQFIHTPNDLLTGFVRIIVCTRDRDAFIGTPKEKTPEIEEFYAVMRRSLIQLITQIYTCEDKDAQKFCISEIGIAGNRCGGRWLGCLHQQLNYLKGKKAQYVSFLDEIYLIFRDRRQAILDTLVFRGHDDVHIHNQIYKLISKHLNLAGADLYENIVDNFANDQLTENRLLGMFYHHYHPLYLTEILNQFLLQMYHNSEKRELLLLWIKSNIPDEFDSHFYLPVIEAVKKALVEKKSRQEITALMQGIYWNPDQPDPLKSVEDHRFCEFMDQIVMDENGHFKLPFLLHMLLTLNILSKPCHQLVGVV